MISKTAADMEYWYQQLDYININYILKIIKMIKRMTIVGLLKFI